MSETGSGAAPKSDPETLVLRGKPPRVTRFKRGVVITIAAGVGVAIMGATWLALRSPSLKVKTTGDELFNTDRKPTSDKLASLPATYDKVKSPVLGPPLPGDLGSSILRQEKNLGISPATGTYSPNNEEDASRADQLRLAQQARQAREGTVFFQSTSHMSEPPATTTPQTAPTEQALQSPSAAPNSAQDQNGQQHKIDFANQRGDDSTINPHALQPLSSPYEILAGSLIPASLVTGLDSDLPGLVIGQVTQDVFDSATGAILLVPLGSKIIGSYDSVVAFGQSRVLVVWKRIIMPNGSSIQIDNLPATDTEGYAGLEDGVDYHTWRLIKGVALSTLLGVGIQLSVNNQNNDLLSALRDSGQNSADQAGQQLTQKNMDIQPTLTVRPGWPLRVIVSRDIILRPYQG